MSEPPQLRGAHACVRVLLCGFNQTGGMWPSLMCVCVCACVLKMQQRILPLLL